jgi:hypothetical protein
VARRGCQGGGSCGAWNSQVKMSGRERKAFERLKCLALG